MKILFTLIFYGCLYPLFEDIFNWVQMDLLDKNKAWAEKLQLRPSNPASLWHVLSGAVIGLILYLFFLIPFKMDNIFIFILVGLLGSLTITSWELGLGILLFRVLKIKRFWNYDKEILNYDGIIGIYHSIAWIGMTYLFWIINYFWKLV